MTILENKKLISFNPFATTRDGLIFILLQGGFNIVAYIVLTKWVVLEGLPPFAIIGANVGILATLIPTLPVRGIAQKEARRLLLNQLTDLGYETVSSANGESVHIPLRINRWSRWDSNRVIVQDLPDGSFAVTCPLGVFKKIAVVQAIPESRNEEVKSALLAGRKIDAVKMLRTGTKMRLDVAVARIEALEEELRRTNSADFSNSGKNYYPWRRIILFACLVVIVLAAGGWTAFQSFR